MHYLKDSYSNPFADYNANGMDSKTVLNYWCNPFAFVSFSGLDEKSIYTEKNPIVFMGGRGSGKTMFLRYWSYQVQKLRILSNPNHIDNKEILSSFKENGGLGFYIRIDGPVLKSFNGCDLPNAQWESIFTHYFELIIARAYIELIQDLLLEKAINADLINNVFIPGIVSLLGIDVKSKDIEEVLNQIEILISEVTTFRGMIPLQKIHFTPAKVFPSQSLSFGIAELIQHQIKDLASIKFVLFIDEYENFSEHQQRMVNTLLKFVKPYITFRIGMRLEGFRTFATVTTDDYIKEGRDYRQVIFDDVLIKNKGYQNYLKDIAKKRLEGIKVFKERNLTDITEILGKNEDLEQEAKSLTIRNRKRHFVYYKKLISSDKIETLTYEENPLLELLNIIWVLRGEDPNEVKVTMNDYLCGINNDKSKKYKQDYVDKYKMSLMFLLASIYHENKRYYSFNTFCYLSSGIVGNFIELCRQSFQFAAFEDPETLFTTGIISRDQQDKAAREVAFIELQGIQRIENFGNLIYKFTLNIGNIFSDYHKDDQLRYPETNQFYVDKNNIEGLYRDAFKTALKWSVIQRKQSIQQTSPGKHRKDIYTINRIFSPQFGISCRTRGGVSEEYNSDDIVSLMTQDQVKSKKLGKKKMTKIKMLNMTKQEVLFEE